MHGLYSLKNALRARVRVDRRSAIGRALAGWHRELVADLGGPEAVSTAQLALVELACRGKLMLDSVDGWLLRQPTLVNRRKRTLIPALRERTSIAAGLERTLTALGLEKKAPPALSFEAEVSEILAERQAEARQQPQPGDGEAVEPEQGECHPDEQQPDDEGDEQEEVPDEE